METKFRKIGDQVEVLMSELRNESIKFITDTIKKVSGDKGSINLYDEDENDSVYVSYDGGSHPEYASNLWSMVYDVHINSKVSWHCVSRTAMITKSHVALLWKSTRLPVWLIMLQVMTMNKHINNLH